jgi:CBS domain containing-hemolysin-like protein
VTALYVAVSGLSVLLIIVLSYIQLLYGEGSRLRRREAPGLEFFEDHVQPRLRMDPDFGRMVYSLCKQTLLVTMAVCFYALTLGGAARGGSTRGVAALEALLFSLLTVVVFSFFVPQLLLRRSRGRWLRGVLPLLIAVAFVVRPVAAVLQFVQTLFGISDSGEDEADESTTAEDIEALIDAGTEEGLIDEEDRKLIQSVVEFRDKTVREVMTARPNVVAIDADRSLEELRDLVIHEQYSRIPVIEGSIDRIVGFVHVRDMFELGDDERERMKVREVMRPIRLVPETKPVKDLLEEMQAEGAHMVAVISEYGQTAGLATMEDLVEEILGEIRDEHEPARDVTQESEGVFLVAGSYDVDHLHELVGFRPEEETESTTIGGLVTEWLGHVPKAGEAAEREGIRLEVVASDEYRVERVRVSRLVSEEPADG